MNDEPVRDADAAGEPAHEPAADPSAAGRVVRSGAAPGALSSAASEAGAQGSSTVGVAGAVPSADLPDDPYIHKMETVVSWVLRIGVVASVLIVLAGLGLMFAHHPSYAHITHGIRYQVLTGPSTAAHPFPHTFGQMISALGRGEGRGVIVLGLVVLLATPILRVAVGVVGFGLERDLKMTLACVFVFLVLMFSLFVVAA